MLLKNLNLVCIAVMVDITFVPIPVVANDTTLKPVKLYVVIVKPARPSE